MRITNIQRMSIDDGPGIRTTVFVKGCPLRCRWCHNPECMEKSVSEAFLNNFKKSFEYDGNVDDLCRILAKDEDFFKKSGGGVTISGGEPLLYADEIVPILKKLKEGGISTAVDTCGCVPRSALEKALPYTDLVLYDLKAASSKLHKECTGAGNELILENFRYLTSQNVRMRIRIPSIGNANSAELTEIAELIPENACIDCVEFLPYHQYGISKYQTLGISYTGDDFVKPDETEILAAAEILKKKGIRCYSAGNPLYLL